MKPIANRSLWIPLLSLSGMLVLAFILGAAAMHFHFASADILRGAFMGGQALVEQEQMRGEAGESAVPSVFPPAVFDRSRACDGCTLYSIDDGAQAVLVDMRGEVRHRWSTSFRKVWPRPRHVARPVDDRKVYFFACHLYPNGDLLAVLHGNGDTPYGYGLVKLNKNSEVVWTYDANVHHAVDVGEDGQIYVLTHEIVHRLPADLEFFAVPALVDSLVVLSADGVERAKVPLLEALRDSPYAALLATRSGAATKDWDILHANHVEVLTRARAARYPRFRAGQVLVSLREISALAVIDLEHRAAVWAARGPWRAQHDPHFLDNGRLLVFDNRGSTIESRILEYDLDTQACPWTFPEKRRPLSFRSVIQGRSQRLPNGNTLIVNSREGMLFEVTPERDVVWSHHAPAHVSWARRFPFEYLSFLEEPRLAPRKH